MYFAYPHCYLDPPQNGNEIYFVDYEKGFWLDNYTILVPYPQNPYALAQYIEEKNLARFPFIPLTEEGVLSCGIANTRFGFSEFLTENKALACTDKLHQRSVLPDKYNISYTNIGRMRGNWFDLDMSNGVVVKARSSTLSKGTKILSGAESSSDNIFIIAQELQRRAYSELGKLKLYYSRRGPVPVNTDLFLVEEYISGPSYEINGIISTSGNILFMKSLLQHWHNDRISKYFPLWPAKVEQLEEAAIEIIEHINLRGCGFNIEFKEKNNQLKVIELHARIGEDQSPYSQLIYPNGNIIDAMIDYIPSCLI